MTKSGISIPPATEDTPSHQATHLTLFQTAICRPTLGDRHPHAPHRSTNRSLLTHQEHKRRQANKHRITRPSTALCKDLNKERKGSEAACFCSCREARQKMHYGACIIAAHCVGHRSTLHPPSQRAASVNTRQNIGSTNAFTIFSHTLEKVREADYALFPQRKTGRCFAATPCHSLGTSLCLRRKIVFRISVAKIQQPFAFCKF